MRGIGVFASIGRALLWTSLAVGAASAQSVTTDKSDYLPGETALISGSGFHADEALTLLVIHFPDPEEPGCSCGAGHTPWTVLTDANGDFSTSWYVDPDDSLGATFLLTADCSDGLHAEHIFSDALGQARVSSVMPFDGGCVLQNLPPSGIERWNVEQAKTYIVTLTNVTDCAGEGTAPTLEVIVHSNTSGYQCLVAQKVSVGVYRFMIRMPGGACGTFPIQYCTTNCVPGDPSSAGTKFVRRSDGGAFQSQLRAADFQPGCTSPIADEVCGCPPLQVSCPLDITACADPVTCCAPVSFSPTVTGGCPGTTWTSDPPSGYCFPIGTTQVTVTAQDNDSHSAQCTFFVTVEDCDAPQLDCPADITVCNDAGQCSAVVTFAATASDACSPPATVTYAPPSGSTFPVGTTQVVATALDAAGNRSQCTFNVTVEDCDAPTVTCSSDLTVCNDPGQCSAVVTFQASVTDNCPGATVSCSPPSGSTFPVGQTTVTCTATDAAGNTSNCSFTVTVNDCEAPTASCPASITTCNDAGLCSAVVDFQSSVSDNCPGSTVSCTPPSGTAFPVGQTTVTCTATDAAGNTSSCSFTVTVDDCEDPTISCSTDITTCTDPGMCSAVVNFTPSVSDNCPGATSSCTPPSGTAFARGTTQVTCTATDASGRTSSCTFNVTVQDCEPPDIQCPPNFVETWTSGPPTQTDPSHTGYAVATDNCSVVLTYSDVFKPGTAPGEPETIVTRTWVATDNWGNQTSCVQTITLLSPSGGGGMHLDAVPGSCPNLVKIWEQPGFTTFALTGTFQVDPTTIDLKSLRLTRVDFVWRKLIPNTSGIADTATPFYGPFAACHPLGADGTPDVTFTIANWKIRRAFQIASFPEGTQVQVALTGRFKNGQAFEARDFITVTHVLP